MAATIAQRLAELGIELPSPAAPAANYVPARLSGNLLVISGQLPMEGGSLRYKGKLGGGVSLEDGQAAARLCAINILAQTKAALGGDLSRIRRVVKLNGFIASTTTFIEQHLVMNGASNLIAKVLGDAGIHARAAVGMAALPFNAAVEIDAVIEIA